MIEALFYFTYYAFLKGELEDARMYYTILREEFNKRKEAEALCGTQYRQLKHVRDSLRTGKICRSDDWVAESQGIQPSPGQKSKERSDQDLLVRKIHEHGYEKLKEELGVSGNFDLYNIEHPCGRYGRVDMVYIDQETIYPVEVKCREGRHDIVGQIEKYALFFRLHLHEKLYKEVKAVTICGSYDSHVLAALKRIGVKPFQYRRRSDGILLRSL